jgi:hypothetical protein
MPVVITGNNTPTAGGVVYGDGTTYATTTAGTSGRPIVSGGAGAPTFRPYTLPAADGSANQILQTDGAGALSFATPSTGAMALLATVNATSGTYVTFDGYFTSAYDVYLITGSNIFVDDTSVSGNLKTQIAIASTYQTTGNYRYSLIESDSNSTSIVGSFSTTSSQLNMNIVRDLYRGIAFSFYIYNPLTTNESKSLTWTLVGRDGSAVLNQNIGVGSFTGSSAALTGIRFFWDVGTFQSGKFQLYGLKNS